jgi:hypothetical protein
VNTSTNTSHRYAAALGISLTLASAGTVVWAQTAAVEPNAATYICRPALANETASAKMMVSSTSLVCRPFAVSMHMSDGSLKTIGNVTSTAMASPDFSQALTPQQVNAAYNHWLQKALDIDPAVRNSP